MKIDFLILLEKSGFDLFLLGFHFILLLVLSGQIIGCCLEGAGGSQIFKLLFVSGEVPFLGISLHVLFDLFFPLLTFLKFFYSKPIGSLHIGRID